MRQHGLLFAFLLVRAAIAAAPEDPVAAVPGGSIRGRLTADGGAAFKGVPFARPPLGELRWREPQPVEPWEGLRDTSRFRAACTQLSEGWNLHDVTGSSEDCLYLNVWTPALRDGRKRPVMVYLHGGGYTNGYGTWVCQFDNHTNLFNPGGYGTNAVTGTAAQLAADAGLFRASAPAVRGSASRCATETRRHWPRNRSPAG